MKTIDTEVLSKIQKLLNLADKDRNNNIGEATTALSFAHKLLTKHHLTMSQVVSIIEDNDLTRETNFFELKESEAVTYAANILPRWLETIIKSVNRVTQTKTLIKRSPRLNSIYGNLSIVFVGDMVDVSSSVELFDFLKNTISRLSSEHSKQYEGKFKYWRSFAEGCSDKIFNRAQELDEQLKKKLDKLVNNDLSVDSRELEDEDEYEEYDEEIERQISEETFNIELYKKYEKNKFDKIKEYVEQIEAEEEKSSSRTSKIDSNSFLCGQKAGEKIPLTITPKLGKKRS